MHVSSRNTPAGAAGAIAGLLVALAIVFSVLVY